MSRTGLVYKSAVASLGVQLLTMGLTVATFFIDIKSEAVRRDLDSILALETVAGGIEFVWYAVAVWNARTIYTWTRYVDWFVSTPAMLVSTALFFHHRRGIPLGDVFDGYLLYVCLGFNACMLGFGLLAELGMLPVLAALAGGGAAFVASFTALATFLGSEDVDTMSVILYTSMYAVWGCYGVAAAFPDTAKNVAYNGLDVVAKNFYGVFLFVYALTS